MIKQRVNVMTVLAKYHRRTLYSFCTNEKNFNKVPLTSFTRQLN